MQQTRLQILCQIESKFEMIQTNQSLWLNSSLEKYRPNVKIDRAVITNPQNSMEKCLILEPNAVKQVAADTFAHQFRKRRTMLDNLSPYWREIYKRQSEFEDAYVPLMESFTEEEWLETTRELSRKSAAGPSGINYRILKKLPLDFIKFILRFYNVCYRTSCNPTAWRQSNIIPILKPEKFSYNISNTRPIALLDVFRKVLTKMITKRLSYILSTNGILKGHNFCGLKEESTSTPLNLLNNVMEDAKDHCKELWILTQDMAKAYDSISMEGLRMSLYRLGIPNIFIDWLINLFEGRSMKVITAFGLSPSLNAADGID